MSEKSCELKYRKMYADMEYQAQNAAYNYTAKDDMHNMGDSYWQIGREVFGGNVFGAVNQAFKALEHTARTGRRVITHIDSNKRGEELIKLETMKPLIQEALCSLDTWESVRRKSTANIAWLCKPKMGTRINDLHVADGKTFYMWFDGKINPVNPREVSFDWSFDDENGIEVEITPKVIEHRLQFPSYATKDIVNGVLKWQRLRLKPNAEYEGKYDYMAFYIYPQYLKCVAGLQGYQELKKSNSGAFVLVKLPYYEGRVRDKSMGGCVRLDPRAMRLCSIDDFSRIFYKGSFAWCLNGTSLEFPSVPRAYPEYVKM